MSGARPPLAFAAEIFLVLALAPLAAALWLGQPGRALAESLRERAREAAAAHFERQLDTAQLLGIGGRGWLGLRVTAALGGLALGSLTGVFTLTVAGFLLGTFGLPWLLAGRAAARRLQLERSLASLALAIRNLMQHSNLALDRALREAARAPAPELAQVLAPLAGDLPVAEGLVELARRARSPLADLLASALLVARTHNPMALVRVTDEVLLPLMQAAVEVQEENHATVAQQRTAAVAVGLIMAALLLAVMRVPTMHEYYSTAAGQLVLVVVMLMYLGLVWILGRVARPLPWADWDIAAVRREAEALVA